MKTKVIAKGVAAECQQRERARTRSWNKSVLLLLSPLIWQMVPIKADNRFVAKYFALESFLIH